MASCALIENSDFSVGASEEIFSDADEKVHLGLFLLSRLTVSQKFRTHMLKDMRNFNKP